MLSQLIYVSTRVPSCTEAEIEKILNTSVENNKINNITGILVYSSNRFLQVLEGDSDVILNLYDKIKEDKRHKNSVMISLKSIDKRLFPGWHMGSKYLKTESVEFMSKMSDEERNNFYLLLDGNVQNNAIDLINKLI